MVLATNEEIIREWEYAKSETGLFTGGTTEHTLTVTNKRLISTDKNNKNTKYNEIALSDVKSISGFCGNSMSPLALVVLIIGIILIYAGFNTILLSIRDSDMVPACVVLLILGIAAVIGAFFLPKKYTFMLLIATKGHEGTPFGVGAMAKMFFKRKTSVKKITVDGEAAQEILDCIGAIIIDNK